MLKTYHCYYIAGRYEYHIDDSFKLFLIKNKTWYIQDWLWNIFFGKYEKGSNEIIIET